MLPVSRLAIGLTVLGLASAGCEANDAAGTSDAAGASDTAMAVDAAADDSAGLSDALASDATVPDTSGPDAPLADAPAPDAAEPDSASTDAAAADAALPVGTAQLGVNGGALTSADGKASVAVPPGVLELPTNFAISLVADPPGDATLVSDVYDFAPDGATFAVPLTLCLAVDEAKIAGMDVCLLFYESATATWTCVDSPLYKAAEGKRCGLTNHFTPFAVGQRPPKTAGPTKLALVKDKQLYPLPGGGVLDVEEGTVAEPLQASAEVIEPPVADGSVGSPVLALGPENTALAKPVTLCLPVDPNAYAAKGGCLAALDTSGKSPNWVCEDPCLTKLGSNLVCGKTVHFRTFAVVLGQGGDAATCAPKTPIGSEGGVVVSPDGAGLMHVPKGALQGTLGFVAATVAPPVPAKLGSAVVRITPSGTKFAEPATVCLRQLAGLEPGDACLGYLDESSQPAVWKCEDACLEKGGGDYLCGKTDHLTNFAILLGTSGGTDPDDSKCGGGENSLADAIDGSGGVVEVAGGKALVLFPPGAVQAPVVPLVGMVTPTVAGDALGSGVVEVSLPQGQQPLQPVTVCLAATEAAKQKGGCLAFLDTSGSEPVWKCEDNCLTKTADTHLCGKTDHFSQFAVLLGQAGDAATCSPKTPIGPEGGVAVSPDGAGLLHVPAGALKTTLPFVVATSASPVDAKLGSAVVSITPSGTQFAQPATVCLRQLAATEPGNACLGYLDESTQPPVWKCEDKCLKKGGGDYLCGQSNHLTNFAILLGSSSGEDKCDSGEDYVVGTSGGLWLFADGAAMVQFPAGAVPSDTSVQLAAVPKPVAPQLLGSAAVDISLADGKQPQVPLTVCLAVSELAQQKGGCLAYLDTSGAEPTWKCEDECLKQISPSFWCGTTNHLTNFAVLLGGGKSKEACDAQALPGFVSAAAGGVLVAGDGGVTLTVPAGALAKDTVFAIAKSGLKTEPALSPAWDIGPEGLTLAKPATLCIKPLQPLQVGEGLCLASADATGKWQCDDPCLSVNTDGLVCGTTDHFSTWAIAKVSGAACK